MSKMNGVMVVSLQLPIIFMPAFYWFFGESFGLENVLFLYGSLIIFFSLCLVNSVNKSFNEMSSRVGKELDSFKSTLTNINTAESIPEEKFYDDFLDKVQGARSIVYTAHLGIDPPSRIMENARDYYKKIWDILGKKKHVEMKRVELFTDSKKVWLKDVVRKMRGKKGFFLWVIDGRENPERFGSALSVQVVDGEVFLVALASHHDRVRDRDILLRGSSFQSLWVDYYNDRLLAQAKILISDGQVDVGFYNELIGECE